MNSLVKITDSKLRKIVNNRMNKIYAEFKEKYGYFERDNIDCFAKYLYAVTCTMLHYVYTHASYFYLDMTTGEIIDNSRSGEYEVWHVVNENCTILLQLLSSDFETVLSALAWANHQTHCQGAIGRWDGRGSEAIDLYLNGDSYYSGLVLVDHGADFGIDYDLVDEISQNGIGYVFPEIERYY